MVTTVNNDTIIPAALGEMVEKVVGAAKSGAASGHQRHLAYVGGWIEGRAIEEYKALVQRDGLPEGPRIIQLLSELAVTRALVRWHEVRDRPPPMPSIQSLD